MLLGERGKLVPRADLIALGRSLDDVLAAVGVVEFENGRLGEGVGGAETVRDASGCLRS